MWKIQCFCFTLIVSLYKIVNGTKQQRWSGDCLEKCKQKGYSFNWPEVLPIKMVFSPMNSTLVSVQIIGVYSIAFLRYGRHLDECVVYFRCRLIQTILPICTFLTTRDRLGLLEYIPYLFWDVWWTFHCVHYLVRVYMLYTEKLPIPN